MVPAVAVTVIEGQEILPGEPISLGLLTAMKAPLTSTALNWLQQKAKSNIVGTIYTNTSTEPSLSSGLGTQPWYWWSADWTGSPFVSPGAVATQYASNDDYDTSLIGNNNWPAETLTTGTVATGTGTGTGTSGSGTTGTFPSAASAYTNSSSATQDLLMIGEFLYANGYSKAGAAGVAGCVAGESGGEPEVEGSGGGGLIGWTPTSSMYTYGGSIGGNATTDFDNQLTAIMNYNKANGNVAALNAYTDPVSAADYYSQEFERPAVTDGDVKPATATSVFNSLASGGMITEHILGFGLQTGHTYEFGESGPELVTPQSSNSGYQAGLAGATSGGEINVTLEFNGVVGDPVAVGQQVQQVLRKYKKVKGNIPLGFD